MFKKFLSKIGIGSASVNLILEDVSGRIGEQVVGHILVEGGAVDQKIDAIDVDFILEARLGDKTARTTIETIAVARDLHVPSGKQIEYPFAHQLPELPISSQYVRYTYHTRLDIPEAIDKHDFDQFYVQPSLSVATAIGAFHALGFYDKHDSGVFNGRYQEFEYAPLSGSESGPFAGRIDELTVVYLSEEDGVRLHIELDKTTKGLFGALADKLDLDESHFTLFLSYHSLQDSDATLQTIRRSLEAELNNPNPSRYPTLPKAHPHGQHKHRGGGAGSGLLGGIAGGIAGYAIGEALFGDDDSEQMADGGIIDDLGDFFGEDD